MPDDGKAEDKLGATEWDHLHHSEDSSLNKDFCLLPNTGIKW